MFEAEWLQRFQTALQPGGWQYETLFAAMIIFFAYFYTAVQFNPVDVADNMKKFGGFIPGVRPGRATAEYIDYVLSRITFGGALYFGFGLCLPGDYSKVGFKPSSILFRWNRTPHCGRCGA